MQQKIWKKEYIKKTKKQFKTFSELLRYVNFGAVAACRVLCVSRAVFRKSLVMYVRASCAT